MESLLSVRFHLLLNQLLEVEHLRSFARRQHVVQHLCAVLSQIHRLYEEPHLQLLGGEDKVEQLPDPDQEDEHDGEQDGGLLEGLDQPEGDKTEQL